MARLPKTCWASLFDNIPVKVRLETSIFNIFDRKKITQLIEKYLNNLQWCVHKTDVLEYPRLSYNKDVQPPFSGPYKPVDQNEVKGLVGILFLTAKDLIVGS